MHYEEVNLIEGKLNARIMIERIISKKGHNLYLDCATNVRPQSVLLVLKSRAGDQRRS